MEFGTKYYCNNTPFFFNPINSQNVEVFTRNSFSCAFGIILKVF